MKTQIVVNLVIEGIHNWPECGIAEVEFLRHPHRHMFHVCAKKAVTDDDRQIEIIMFKRAIADYFVTHYGTPCNFGRRSCEEIAQKLAKRFSLDYCSVLEDGENGAEIINE